MNDAVLDIPKSKEIKGFVDKGTFKIIDRDDIEIQANILGGRFLLAVKNVETNDPTYKDRFVVQGDADRGK